MKSDYDEVFSRRKFVFSGLYVACTTVLIGKLYNLQIPNNAKYKLLSHKNRIRYLMLDPQRGRILDVNGEVIADNKKFYKIMYENYASSEVVIEELLTRLRDLIVLSRTDIEEVYYQFKSKKTNILIKKDVKWNELSIIEANIFNLSGLYITHSYKRFYPYAECCAHVLGYVTSVQKSGISGLELIHDDHLIGKPGLLLREVNSQGAVVKESSYISPVVGKDVKVSINVKVQNFSYRMLALNSQKIRSGSIVILNIENGMISTLTNFPSYDNNIFIDTLLKEEWKRLSEISSNPLINRCVNFKISPGSTFKMISAICALETGLITSETEFECKGHIDVGDKRFNCWNKKGHGKIKLKEAISMSCNAYFYNVALKINIDTLFYYAEHFGMSEYFNLGLKDEVKVSMPNKKWRAKNTGGKWYTGDSMNAIIGHGYLAVTPIHLAVMSARIASGVKVVPSFDYVNKEFSNLKFSNLSVSFENLRLIRSAMFDVINSSHGTARRAASSLHHIAGKTGTVQMFSNIYTQNEHNFEHNYNHTSVFVGYAPYEKPKYAISVVMEQGGGGKNAAMVAMEIFDYILIGNY